MNQQRSRRFLAAKHRLEEEAKAKAVEEGRIQLAKVMKLVEDKGLPPPPLRIRFPSPRGAVSLSFFWS